MSSFLPFFFPNRKPSVANSSDTNDAAGVAVSPQPPSPPDSSDDSESSGSGREYNSASDGSSSDSESSSSSSSAKSTMASEESSRRDGVKTRRHTNVAREYTQYAQVPDEDDVAQMMADAAASSAAQEAIEFRDSIIRRTQQKAREKAARFLDKSAPKASPSPQRHLVANTRTVATAGRVPVTDSPSISEQYVSSVCNIIEAAIGRWTRYVENMASKQQVNATQDEYTRTVMKKTSRLVKKLDDMLPDDDGRYVSTRGANHIVRIQGLMKRAGELTRRCASQMPGILRKSKSHSKQVILFIFAQLVASVLEIDALLTN